jgi:hypothetical protein
LKVWGTERYPKTVSTRSKSIVFWGKMFLVTEYTMENCTEDEDLDAKSHLEKSKTKCGASQFLMDRC